MSETKTPFDLDLTIAGFTPAEHIKIKLKIWEWLFLALEINEVKNISQLCKDETKRNFVEQVKVFIVHDLGRFYGFYIEFGNDFETVTKKQYLNDGEK